MATITATGQENSNLDLRRFLKFTYVPLMIYRLWKQESPINLWYNGGTDSRRRRRQYSDTQY